MKVIYIADDGTEFNDECDCEQYEWLQSHKDLEKVLFYNSNGIQHKNYFSQDDYDTTDKIIVQTDSALNDLKCLADYTGFCSYGDITSCGTWVFSYDTGNYGFIKESEDIQ